jgi:hypothetical protein
MAGGFVPKHGGYQDLHSSKKALIVFDATVFFCDQFVDRRSRTHDQMVQAARSGKQNIVEGSMASGTSKETEIKLTNVARAGLEELLEDYRDYELPATLRHSKTRGLVRSQRSVSVTPDDSSAQVLVRAPRMASSSVLPATVRQASRPLKVMQTSHSKSFTWKLE